MCGNKIIKVDTELNVTIHYFPEGTIREQNHQLCELIGNGCDTIERVTPRRLYDELGHSARAECQDSKCVSMLVYEEFLFRDGIELNRIGSYLYGTDRHGNPIFGNILFVGEECGDDGILFTGLERGVCEKLLAQLVHIATGMKQGLL